MELVLSYFDKIRGPRIVLSMPAVIPKNERGWILNLLDIYTKTAFFEYVNAEQKNLHFVNYLFEVESEWARGGAETVLVTAILERKMDLKMLEYRFKEYTSKFHDVPNIFKGLYKDTKTGADVEEAYEQIQSIMAELYKFLQRKSEQLHLIDRIFTRFPITKNSPVSWVNQAIISTFITTLDARTTDGAMILHNVGTRFARSISEIFIERDVELLIEELARFWKTNSFGDISNIKVTEVTVTFDVEDCFECSNLPNIGYSVCKFQEGFLTAIFQEKVSPGYLVTELECTGKGADHCSFMAKKDTH